MCEEHVPFLPRDTTSPLVYWYTRMPYATTISRNVRVRGFSCRGFQLRWVEPFYVRKGQFPQDIVTQLDEIDTGRLFGFIWDYDGGDTNPFTAPGMGDYWRVLVVPEGIHVSYAAQRFAHQTVNRKGKIGTVFLDRLLDALDDLRAGPKGMIPYR